MFSVTVLCNPTNMDLDPDVVANLRNAWGGSATNWLSPNEAAEFFVQSIPENRWQVWSDFQSFGFDLVVQPNEHRKKRLLLADMDSTIIEQECIDELADVAGFGELVAAITARAMNGEIDFDDALRERVGLLKGLEISVIDTVLADRITLAPGARPLLATMRKNGARTALVSGGFTAFTGRIAETLAFDEHHANVLLEEAGVLTGEVANPILGREAKVKTLARLSDQLKLDRTQTMAVGDGANDLGMLAAAGAGVALHAKPSVAEQCDLRINFADLTSLLFLQGYNKSAFVT